MLRNLSLQGRLLFLFGGLIAVGFSIGLGALILSAAPRARAEADSAMRLSRDFVDTALAAAKASSSGPDALNRLLSDFANLRHVKIYLEGAEAQKAAPPTLHAPGWFQSLVAAKSNRARVTLEAIGRPGDALIIETNPGDEVEEVWDDFKELAIGGALVALVGYFLLGLLLSRSLRPIARISAGLRRLEGGRYDVRIPLEGPSDFVDMATRLNALSVRLGDLEHENQQLGQRIVRVQDDERREIARNLHDEFGPLLFAIRARLSMLVRQPPETRSGTSTVEQAVAELAHLVQDLQQINRRILGQLRPAALAEFGLGGALEALVADWRQIAVHIETSLRLDPDLETIDETIGLTAYRIVQEALTNVARHAGAARVEVRIAAQANRLLIAVEDNGAGFDPSIPWGLGLKGMSERISALGGSLKLSSSASGGAQVLADLPCRSG
ncbi:MAG TPA: histidine kinase [Rhodoblastus sp.]|nr:histidine kinase [Rhodoblastus sp.]